MILPNSSSTRTPRFHVEHQWRGDLYYWAFAMDRLHNIVLISLVVVRLGLATSKMHFNRGIEARPLEFCFIEFKAGDPFPGAAFYVTNVTDRALVIDHVQVQTLVDDGWHTLATGPIQLIPGSSEVLLEAGSQRQMLIEWPGERPSRLCIFYFRECRGLEALKVKVQHAWRTRSLSRLTGREWGRLDQMIAGDIVR